MQIVNVISTDELEKLHQSYVKLVEHFNSVFVNEKWSVSDILETEVSFSFRVYLNGETDLFCQWVKR